jgi:hypothetical protein
MSIGLHTMACLRPSRRTARNDIAITHNLVVLVRDALPQNFNFAKLKVRGVRLRHHRLSSCCNWCAAGRAIAFT